MYETAEKAGNFKTLVKAIVSFCLSRFCIFFLFFSSFIDFSLLPSPLLPAHMTCTSPQDAAGLKGVLSGPGPVTVFAPNDEAFSKLPAGEVDKLLTVISFVPPLFLSACLFACRMYVT